MALRGKTRRPIEDRLAMRFPTLATRINAWLTQAASRMPRRWRLRQLLFEFAARRAFNAIGRGDVAVLKPSTTPRWSTTCPVGNGPKRRATTDATVLSASTCSGSISGRSRTSMLSGTRHARSSSHSPVLTGGRPHERQCPVRAPRAKQTRRTCRAPWLLRGPQRGLGRRCCAKPIRLAASPAERCPSPPQHHKPAHSRRRRTKGARYW